MLVSARMRARGLFPAVVGAWIATSIVSGGVAIGQPDPTPEPNPAGGPLAQRPAEDVEAKVLERVEKPGGMVLPPGQLYVIVRSVRTGKPLAGETLVIEPGGISATSREDGVVTVDLAPGEYVASLSGPGFVAPLTVRIERDSDRGRTEPESEPAPAPAPAPDSRGFRFGSYGRILAGTDLRGGKPETANVVAHGPRIVEPSYLELDFSFGFVTPRGMKVRPVITIAFNATLFHDTGDFDAQPALRNVFLEAEVTKAVTAWAGSRMYRGDDIYLFDYWPLDDLNTVGGGVMFRASEKSNGGGDAIELATHAGVNRLTDAFQFQEITVPDPAQGSTTVIQLDRQRMILSGTGSYLRRGAPGQLSIKVKAHAELHALPSGTRERTDGTLEALPSDRGWLAGAQVSAFGLANDPAHRDHLNLYMRYAKGLAAFDELVPPTSFGPELKTTRASELTFGAAGAWDHARGNIMLGALSRRFVDADTTSTDPDDGWEYALDIRPLAKVVRELYVGVDLSYQARFPRGLNPNTLRAEDPAVFQIAPMLVYSPVGPSAYDRPQLRLVYRVAHLNEAARDEFVPDDRRHDREWTHFLGFQAEWWFNSSTYR